MARFEYQELSGNLAQIWDNDKQAIHGIPTGRPYRGQRQIVTVWANRSACFMTVQDLNKGAQKSQPSNISFA
jgi:hypothetical protein